MSVLETVFKRWFGAVVLVGVTATSYVTSVGVNSLATASLVPLTVPSTTSPPRFESDRDAPEANHELIARLLTVEGLLVDEGPEQTIEPEQAMDDTAGETSDSYWGCRSSAPVVLVGTMVDGYGAWSFGIVQDQAANRTVLASPGMSVGGAEVLAVERQRIWVRNDGRLECLEPNQQPVEPPPPRAERDDTQAPEPTPEQAPEHREVRPPSATGLDSAVSRRGAHEFDVDRAAIERAWSDPELVRRQSPQLGQYLESNRAAGIEVTDVPTGSIFSQMGIRDGDVLREVNGTPLTTIQRAADVLDALRHEDRVEVRLDRRGRSLTLTYFVR